MSFRQIVYYRRHTHFPNDFFWSLPQKDSLGLTNQLRLARQVGRICMKLLLGSAVHSGYIPRSLLNGSKVLSDKN